MAMPAGQARVANETSGGCRANVTCARAQCDAMACQCGVLKGRYAPPDLDPALHLFVHCAKGRGIRPAARIRLILGQIGARPLHAEYAAPGTFPIPIWGVSMFTPQKGSI